MKKNKIDIIIAFIASAALFAAVFPFPAHAENPQELVKRGNRSFHSGEYEKAIEYYGRALVREPESAIIFFNQGDAHYRNGEFEKAADQFMKAADRTKELSLEARAWYNMGNSSMMLGRRESDTDMKKALEHYRTGVTRYQTALKKDSTLHDAAVNMEIARTLIKDLLDKIKKQEEMKKKQQEQMKEIVDSLVSIANRQDEVGKETTEAAEQKGKNRSGWKGRTAGAGNKQGEIKSDTENVKEKIGSLPGAGQAAQLQQAISHIDSSLAAQDEALDDLSKMQPEEAGGSQKESLEQIAKAIASLTDNKNQGEQGDQQKEQQDSRQGERQQQDQKDRQEERNATASQILAEEKEDREKRRKMRRQSSGYTPVEKDW